MAALKDPTGERGVTGIYVIACSVWSDDCKEQIARVVRWSWGYGPRGARSPRRPLGVGDQPQQPPRTFFSITGTSPFTTNTSQELPSGSSTHTLSCSA